MHTLNIGEKVNIFMEYWRESQHIPGILEIKSTYSWNIGDKVNIFMEY